MQFTILSPQIGISEESYLGGGVTDREFLYRLAERGHRIEILLPEGESYRTHKNINIQFIPKNFLLKKSYTINLYFLNSIISVLKSKSIDILRVHSPYSIGIGISLLKLFKKCPPVWFSFHHLENRIDWAILDRILPHFADGITVLSNDTFRDLKSRFNGLDRKLIKVTPLGIDTEIFKRIEKPNLSLYCDGRISLDKPVVLFVGLLIKRKGIDILIKSWQIIKKYNPEAQLIIVGQGPLEYKIKKLKNMDANVFHIKYVSQRNLANFYSSADVFLFPTLKEGFGMAVGEAMSCGAPVVISNAKGVRDLVVDGKTGFKVKIGDYRSFADKVLFLLRNKDLAQQMGREASKRIYSDFSWEDGVDATEEFIERLVSFKKKKNFVISGLPEDFKRAGLFKKLEKIYRSPITKIKWRHRPVRVFNFFVAKLGMYFRKTNIWNHPIIAIIETSSICNLHCLLCPTGQGVLNKQKGIMDLENFKKIIDKIGKYLYIVYFQNWGEPLLNPWLPEMVKYANSRGISTHLSSNLHNLNEEVAERLICSGLEFIKIPIDGLSQDTYSKFRIGGNLDLVMNNLKLLIKKKNKLKSKTPFISVQMMITRHNESEIKRMTEEIELLGANQLLFGQIVIDLSNKEALGLLPTNPVFCRYDLEQGIDKYRKSKSCCNFLWDTITVDWDGNVSPCCFTYDTKLDVGNILKTDFRELWNSPILKKARSSFLNKNDFSKDHICYRCKGHPEKPELKRAPNTIALVDQET